MSPSAISVVMMSVDDVVSLLVAHRVEVFTGSSS
jgi:hypothetical protein